MKPWENAPIVGKPAKPWADAPKAGSVAAPAEPTTKPWADAPPVHEQAEGGPAAYAKEGFGGFNKGLSEILGAPVDLVNAGLSLVGLGSEKPFGGSESIRSAMSSVGDMWFEPVSDDKLARVIRRTGEELGAAALPAAGVTKLAMKSVPAYQTSQSLMRRVFLDPIKAAPGRATVGEAVATVGSGVGAGVAREVAPGSKGAETTGQIVGGVLPTVVSFAPSAVAAKITGKVVSRFSKTEVRKRATKQVHDLIGKELSGDAKSKLAETSRLTSRLADEEIEFSPSVAESTQSPALLRQQTDIESDATGEFLEKLVQRKQQNLDAVERYSDVVAPKSDADIQYIVNTANNRVKTVGAKIDTEIQKVNDAQIGLTDKVPNVNRLATGEEIRSGIETARREASLKMSTMAEELNLNGVDLTPEFKDFKNYMKMKFSPSSRFADKDAIPGAVRDIVNDQGKQTSFNDIKALRERVSDDIINEIGSANPNRKKLRGLITSRQDIDGFLEDNAGKLGDNYKQFRLAYYENYVKPFESGAVFKSKSKSGTGFYTTPAEKVAEIFFKGQSAAKQYVDIFKGDEHMLSVMRESALDDMRRVASDDGVLNQRKLTSWAARNKDALSEIPGLLKDVTNIESANRVMLDRIQTLGARKRRIENIALSKFITRFKQDATADKLVMDAVKSPQLMRQLKNATSVDPEAYQGLKKMVWGMAVSGDSASTLQFMAKYDRALGTLFSKNQLKDMYDITFMQALNETTPTPTGSPIDAAQIPEFLKKVENLTGMKIPQFGTRMYALKSGRVGTQYVVTEALMTAFTKAGKRHADEILKEALYDQRIAADIAGSAFDKTPKQIKAKRLNARIAALGLPYMEEDDQ